MIWANYLWELFLVAYLLGIFLGFGSALDIVEQAKEAGFEYDSKWKIVKWMLNPRKKESINSTSLRTGGKE